VTCSLPHWQHTSADETVLISIQIMQRNISRKISRATVERAIPETEKHTRDNLAQNTFPRVDLILEANHKVVVIQHTVLDWKCVMIRTVITTCHRASPKSLRRFVCSRAPRRHGGQILAVLGTLTGIALAAALVAAGGAQLFIRVHSIC
jgi:hypothetical protein